MPNQQMIENWQRGQQNYPQARYFTPGRQQQQYRTLERGRPREMNLLVVIHNDVPPADLELQRVDVIVHSGDTRYPAEHANGHLVNVYDEQAGVTDHTALYSEADLAQIAQSSGQPAMVGDWEAEGGPPGAQVYSVRAKMRTNAQGQSVIDTHQPIQRGRIVDRYTLHDVQMGTQSAAQRQVLSTPRTPGISSQAGLASMRGPRHSYPSVPRPGELGSRFNPGVREREQSSPETTDPSAIRSSDVPWSDQVTTSDPPGPSRSERMRTCAEMISETVRGGVTGAKLGGKAGSVVPGLGTAAGTAIGAGVGANQAQQVVAREAGDIRLAFATGSATGGVVGGVVNAKRAAAIRDRRVAEQDPAPQQAPEEATQRGKQPQSPETPKQTSLGERFKETKSGQVVQSEGFQQGVHRVGGEAARDAAAAIGRARQSGASGKGVAASAAKGAASGIMRGVRSEMASRDRNRSTQPAEPSSSPGSAFGADVIDRVGKTASSAQGDTQKDTRPVSERYDYQFDKNPDLGTEREAGS